MRRQVYWIVIHVAECPRKPGKALAVRKYMESVGVSCHYVVDTTAIVPFVPEERVAWHAVGANSHSIGIELCGYSRDAWDDAEDELKLAAGLVADICKRWGIPVQWLTASDLKHGKKGITGHKECTDAFLGGRGHWDPGDRFDRKGFILAVLAANAIPPKVMAIM